MYAAQIAIEYPHGPEDSADDFPLAVNLYRQLLSASPDKSVTIVTAGYLNNIQALLKSDPDEHSSLSGPDLVRRKVKLLACIGGQYPSGNEFNFRVEPKAASYVVNNWPARVMYTGFELGNQIRTAGRLAETPANNPIRRVYVDIKSTPDPDGNQDQGYLLERVRFPVIEELDALMNLTPNDGTPSKPGWPSNLIPSVFPSNQKA